MKLLEKFRKTNPQGVCKTLNDESLTYLFQQFVQTAGSLRKKSK